ncbi:MAG: phosphonate ABC transporter, permease protein PhnE [Erysipelotrichaceae bacterium]|jgi:phosphonate transport system permease protein|nr:phosphonate ABC transporter, permease protein PhnE [Bacillota bacterium]HCY06890.1 phosphonate ABC transporter, permease protein PhnE [Erysipelotrichaceae bacterium]
MDKLFNKFFKPEVITLESGNSVERPRSKKILILSILFIVVYVSLKVTGFNLTIIIKRSNQLTVILSQIFNPNFGYFKNVVRPLVDTVKMSLLGSVIGCLLSIPFSILASSNINKNKPILLFVRFVLSIIRSIPTLIIASVAALIFNLGTFAGTIAISIFTFGIVSKMLFESIETLDMGPFEALESFGCNKFQAFWGSCVPQVLPTYFSHCLYCFEMNIRAASILGYVGAGGLGVLINERIGWRDYNGLGMVLLSLFVLVLLIDQLSSYLRSKLG